jgi:hypothetical protein
MTVLTSPIGPDLKHHLRALKLGRLLDVLLLPGAEDSDVDGVHGADVVAC